MTVKEAREYFNNLSREFDDCEIILQGDPEGNFYRKVIGFDENAVIKDEEDLDIYDLSWTAEEACMDEEEWEKVGTVNNVVFPTGALIDKGRLYVYYGAADKLIGLKSVNLEGLLEELKNN